MALTGLILREKKILTRHDPIKNNSIWDKTRVKSSLIFLGGKFG
jgi:hypothetical protein